MHPAISSGTLFRMRLLVWSLYQITLPLKTIIPFTMGFTILLDCRLNQSVGVQTIRVIFRICLALLQCLAWRTPGASKAILLFCDVFPILVKFDVRSTFSSLSMD